jgi:DNA-binding transcriptional regulator LsrR (DeoR family)
MRFFDPAGAHIESAFDERVLGIAPETLMKIPRRVAVAGGLRKSTAIRAALRGGWVNVLITDLQVARSLI